MEDHAAKAVGEHRRHLSGFHVVGIEHGSGTGAHLLGRAIRIPLAQIVRASGGAVAAAEAGPVVPIGGQHVEAEGLVQADVAGKGAITGSHQHLLPIPGIAAAAGLQVMAMALEGCGALQQFACGFLNLRTLIEPAAFGRTEIPQLPEAFEAGNGCGGWRQAEHP